MAHHRVQQWATFARQWWVYDAKWQCPFRSAPVVIRYLQGKHKPIYHPCSNCGDHVIVINSKHIAMADQLWRTFKYFHHSGYAGGATQTRAWIVHQDNPTRVFRNSVYSRMNGNLQRRLLMERLHIFPDEDVPDELLENLSGQIQQVMVKPRSLHEYTQEERDHFPALFDWPEDHELHPGQYGKPDG